MLRHDCAEFNIVPEGGQAPLLFFRGSMNQAGDWHPFSWVGKLLCLCACCVWTLSSGLPEAVCLQAVGCQPLHQEFLCLRLPIRSMLHKMQQDHMCQAYQRQVLRSCMFHVRIQHDSVVSLIVCTNIPGKNKLQHDQSEVLAAVAVRNSEVSHYSSVLCYRMQGLDVVCVPEQSDCDFGRQFESRQF